MSKLRQRLEHRLLRLPDLQIGPWKDSDLICLFYKGKDFAHFHGDQVLDIRLSSKIIRQAQLPRQIAATRHPTRSKASRWIEVEFSDDDDIERLGQLVQLACAELTKGRSPRPNQP